MNGWHRIVAAVVATEVVALAGAAAGAGLLIIMVFYAGGYALHAIELSDPKSLVNQRKAKALLVEAQPVEVDVDDVIDLRDRRDEPAEQPVALA
jgi:predicted RNA methylase